MTSEKISYLQCLKHTGKKVYKYWFIALGINGVLIGLGLVVSSAWQQIVNGFKYIGNGIGYVLSTIGSFVNSITTICCSISWYWWVGIGIIAGPLVLVAIYCALKHYNISIGEFLFVIITIAALIKACIFIWSIISLQLISNIDFVIGLTSCVWCVCVCFILNVLEGDNNNDRYY